MQPALESLASGFPYLIFYLLTITVIFLAGLFVYIKLTPHKEIELVQDGNMAAATHFSALVMSLALPLAACLINKFSLYDVAIWGTFSVLLQLFLFRLTDAIFGGMPERIVRGEVAPAMVLASFKVAGSIILAFAIAG
jgi:putative membrane protein